MSAIVHNLQSAPPFVNSTVVSPAKEFAIDYTEFDALFAAEEPIIDRDQQALDDLVAAVNEWSKINNDRCKENFVGRHEIHSFPIDNVQEAWGLNPIFDQTLEYLQRGGSERSQVITRLNKLCSSLKANDQNADGLWLYAESLSHLARSIVSPVTKKCGPGSFAEKYGYQINPDLSTMRAKPQPGKKLLKPFLNAQLLSWEPISIGSDIEGLLRKIFQGLDPNLIQQELSAPYFVIEILDRENFEGWGVNELANVILLNSDLGGALQPGKETVLVHELTHSLFDHLLQIDPAINHFVNMSDVNIKSNHEASEVLTFATTIAMDPLLAIRSLMGLNSLNYQTAQDLFKLVLTQFLIQRGSNFAEFGRAVKARAQVGLPQQADPSIVAVVQALHDEIEGFGSGEFDRFQKQLVDSFVRFSQKIVQYRLEQLQQASLVGA